MPSPPTLEGSGVLGSHISSLDSAFPRVRWEKEIKDLQGSLGWRRRAGGVVTHPPPPSPLGLGLPSPAALAEGLDQQLPPTGFRMARGGVAGRLRAGPSLLFGKALWPALETDLGASA